jgi:uncharacterized membrane protein YfcA
LASKQKKLNTALIKGVVMFFMGILTGIGGAITGIGTQVAAAPMIEFLLGFNKERTSGTAIVFALFAAACGTVGAGLGGIRVDAATAIVLALSATFGAILVTRAMSSPKLILLRRIAQSLAMLIGVYVIGGAVRFGAAGPPPLHIELFQSSTGLVLIGLSIGALSGLLQIATGILMVPALVLLAGKPIGVSIATSLIVVALASLLPAVVHTSQQRVDSQVGSWMILGGSLGGIGGGFLLSKLVTSGSPIPLIAFGLVAMFVSAVTLQRMS